MRADAAAHHQAGAGARPSWAAHERIVDHARRLPHAVHAERRLAASCAIHAAELRPPRHPPPVGGVVGSGLTQPVARVQARIPVAADDDGVVRAGARQHLCEVGIGGLPATPPLGVAGHVDAQDVHGAARGRALQLHVRHIALASRRDPHPAHCSSSGPLAADQHSHSCRTLAAAVCLSVCYMRPVEAARCTPPTGAPETHWALS